jgi:hypothetical protein
LGALAAISTAYVGRSSSSSGKLGPVRYSWAQSRQGQVDLGGVQGSDFDHRVESVRGRLAPVLGVNLTVFTIQARKHGQAEIDQLLLVNAVDRVHDPLVGGGEARLVATVLGEGRVGAVEHEQHVRPLELEIQPSQAAGVVGVRVGVGVRIGVGVQVGIAVHIRICVGIRVRVRCGIAVVARAPLAGRTHGHWDQ